MFSFGKKKGPVLGLDINSDSITLIGLDKTRAGIEVRRFACSPTPGNAVREGLVADPETIGALVQGLMTEANIPFSGPSPIINVAVPAQAVVIRLMPVPVGMPPEELADVVTQEATNHVPFPIEDANLDWSPMPATERTDADGVRRIDIILAAIQRSIIESYWRLADTAGVKLGRVDISSLAVVRSLALAGYLGSSGHLSMVVNMRHDATDINIVRSAMPLFGRSIMIGMDTLTEAVSRSLGMHFDEALDLLPEIVLFGVPPTDARMGQAAQVARTVFSDIADELIRSLEFYKSQVGDVKVDQIILSGPGTMIQNLDQFISNRMNLRTLVCDPMRDLVFESDLIVDSMRPILAALVGSSIEPSWNPSFTVDLDLNKEGRLPLLYDERKTQAIVLEKPQQWFKPALIAAVASVVIAGSVWAYFAAWAIPQTDTELKKLSADIAKNKVAVTQLGQVRKDNTLLSAKKDLLDKLIKRSSHWSEVLSDIRKKTPEAVHIDSISMEDQTVKINGQSTDFANVSHFAVNLCDTATLRGCSVESASRSDHEPEKILFEIHGNLKGASNEPAAIASLASGPAGSSETKTNLANELPKIPKTLGLKLEAPTGEQ
ncbi:MAG TPA: type IV pilus assembly protein PilM [Oculatellaceae cyanobacterium]